MEKWSCLHFSLCVCVRIFPQNVWAWRLGENYRDLFMLMCWSFIAFQKKYRSCGLIAESHSNVRRFKNVLHILFIDPSHIMSLTPLPFPKQGRPVKKPSGCYAGKTPLLVWQSCKTYPATRTHLDLVFGGGFFSWKLWRIWGNDESGWYQLVFWILPEICRKEFGTWWSVSCNELVDPKVFVAQFEDVRCSVKENCWRMMWWCGFSCFQAHALLTGIWIQPIEDGTTTPKCSNICTSRDCLIDMDCWFGYSWSQLMNHNMQLTNHQS